MIIIGEKINIANRRVAEAVQTRDERTIRELITLQYTAGCDYLDLHAGLGGDETVTALCWLIDQALACCSTPLCLDCPDPQALARAAAHLAGRRPWLLNSLDGSPRRLAAMTAIAAENRVPVIALAMDQTGLSLEPARRLDACGAIYDYLLAAGLTPEAIYFDAIVLPRLKYPQGQRVTLAVIDGIHQRFPQAKTVLGLSNISYGMKGRRPLHHALAAAAVTWGVEALIMDPTDPELRRLARG